MTTMQILCLSVALSRNSTQNMLSCCAKFPRSLIKLLYRFCVHSKCSNIYAIFLSLSKYSVGVAIFSDNIHIRCRDTFQFCCRQCS